MNIQVDPTSSNLASAMLNSKIRPRAVVGYGVKVFYPSPPNYVTRSPGKETKKWLPFKTWCCPKMHCTPQRKLKLLMPVWYPVILFQEHKQNKIRKKNAKVIFLHNRNNIRLPPRNEMTLSPLERKYHEA